MAMQKLWQRRLVDGGQVEACLWPDLSLGETTCKISVRSLRSDDVARRLADQLRCSLDSGGATPLREKA
jgi:hypothetical protein